MIAALGMHPATGRRLTGLDHIRESIRQILTTPIGSRIERRDFGSRLPDLIDAPLNATTRLQAIAASAEAILRWEPRIAIERINIEQASNAPARLVIEIEATVVESGEAATLEVFVGGTA